MPPCGVNEFFSSRSERSRKLTSCRGREIRRRCRQYLGLWRQSSEGEGPCDPNLKGPPFLLADVSTTASCIPELQQCPKAWGSAASPAEVGPKLPAPACDQPSTSRADRFCPGGKPAPAQRIQCDIDPSKCAQFWPPKQTRACKSCYLETYQAIPILWPGLDDGGAGISFPYSKTLWSPKLY